MLRVSLSCAVGCNGGAVAPAETVFDCIIGASSIIIGMESVVVISATSGTVVSVLAPAARTREEASVGTAAAAPPRRVVNMRRREDVFGCTAAVCSGVST